jgi:hypothetical protein
MKLLFQLIDLLTTKTQKTSLLALMNKTLHEKVEEYLGEDEEVMLADGFEDAFIGIGRQFSNPPCAIYDREKCIEILIEDGMDYEEAEEYFEYNVQGAYVGESTPMFIKKID